MWEACCGYCALETAGVCILTGFRVDVLCCQALFFFLLWRVSYWDPIRNGLRVHLQLRVTQMLWLASSHAPGTATGVFDWLPTELATLVTSFRCDAGPDPLSNTDCEDEAKSEFFALSASLAASLSVLSLVLSACKSTTF